MRRTVAHVTADDAPLACTLDTGQLQDRRAVWRSLEPAVVSATRTDGGVVVRYRGEPQVRELLPGLVEAEAACCAFVQWHVTDDGDDVLLTVTADDDGVAALAAELGAAPA